MRSVENLPSQPPQHLEPDFIKNLPDSPGVYLMKDSSGKVLYVGKASSLKKRLAFYFSGGSSAASRFPIKTRALLSRTFYVDYIVCLSVREALILEDRLIKNLRPFYNILLRDDKTYPYLRLSLSEKFPSLSFARILPGYAPRRQSRDLYFGPYPETPGLKSFAFWLNKTFGLKLCRKIPEKIEDRKRCLYRQTGECGCDCVSEEFFDSDKYKSGLRAAKMFFAKGRLREKFETSLERMLKEYVQKLEFEKAARIRDIIFTLKKISRPIRAVREVDEKVYASLSGTTEKLENLRRTLHLARFPSVIECADISNLSGGFAVGSVVRFTAGEPDKDNYRRFRIKNPALVSGAGKQNDFAMMEEVVYRRLLRLISGKEKMGIGLPDLFVVDGGEGQLNAALRASRRAGLSDGKLDIIAISKSGGAHDEIYFLEDKKNPSDIRRLIVPPDDKSLGIISFIRDEAHRFAVSYHKKLRDQRFRINK